MKTEIVKLGGSLFAYSRDIMRFLIKLSEEHGLNIVVVPGGGPFASFIRKIAYENSVSDDNAHWMAVLAMHQYAFFFTADPSVNIVERIEDMHAHIEADDSGVHVFLPFMLLRLDDRLEHSWRVSSDTIAAFVAMKLGADRFVKLTDVDGIYHEKRLIRRISADEIVRRSLFGCIDEALPEFLRENCMKCIVVNGKYAERVAKVLLGEETTCTEIIP